MNEPGHLVPSAVRARAKSASRIPFALGRRFFLLLLIGLVWLGPAWANPRYIYAMFLWDIAVSVFWLWDFVRIPPPGQLEVHRIWLAPVQLSVESGVRVEIRNDGKESIFAELFDDIPQAFRSEAFEAELSVPRGETASAVYSVKPQERGDASVGESFLKYGTAWRIAQRWASAPLAQRIRIYPNLDEAKRDTIYLIRSRQIALQARHKHLRGQGREFESLRDYQQGDEWRNICWTATARRGKLITKTHQFERNQSVWIVLDTGRLLRARGHGLTKLDYAVGAALTVAQVALYSGDRVALLAYGRRITQRVPAGHGRDHLRALIESLAKVHTESLEADHPRAAQALLTAQKRRSLVIWFTDLAETATVPDVIESASLLVRRHLVLLVVMAQPELRALLESRPENESEMFHYVAAEEIVHRRDALLAMLRQQGALTLEIEPAKVSSAVVNEYLRIKELGAI
ncbi:MAG TPA: DUF58 domain-containing protein [Candidatus Acidoferrales bacterium]|nr:DUF58 domain-containing protein [Candidatus Acidoferrales bacterium]